MMKDGTEVTIRPIRPEDEPLIVDFHETLSERSVYLRYFRVLQLDQRIAHDRLTHICFIDYDRQMALVAEHEEPATGKRSILGVGRMTKIQGTSDAEFAILISDDVHGQGLGTELLRQVVQVAHDENIERLTADIMAENMEMRRIARKLGFTVKDEMGEPTVRAVMEL
jgi:acetyltransferase